MSSLWSDVRYGMRMLWKNPGFTLIAVITLSLGIGATTAIFSVVHAVVLDPFPYKDVDNLMSVRVSNPARPEGRVGYNIDQFLEIAERNNIFEGVIASTISDIEWTDGTEPKRLRGNYGTFNTFEVMGVSPLLGRTYTFDDAKNDKDPVAVLGYIFWQKQFAGNPNVIGRKLRLDGQIRTVIGIMPKRFMWRGADVYLPATLVRGKTLAGLSHLHLLGRLKPGVSEAQAEADLQPIIADLKKKEPSDFPEKWKVSLLPFKETFPSTIRQNLWIIFAAVGLLLLIACVNVSNLLLVKAFARQKEMAMRATLGASRFRLIRQLLTESLIIAVVGGGIGILIAYATIDAIPLIVPQSTIPAESEITLNIPVLLFTVTVSCLTAAIFSLAPALHTFSKNLARPIQESGRSGQGGSERSLMRNGLLIAEVALSLILLVGAGLMLRAYIKLQNADIGFRTDNVLTMRVPLPKQRYQDQEKKIKFFQELLQKVNSIPGVQTVGINNTVHPFGIFATQIVTNNNQRDSQPVIIHQINSGYLKALDISLIEGRQFDSSEVDTNKHLAIVNRSFAQTRLDTTNKLGGLINIPRLKHPPFGLTDDSFQIIGIVEDTWNQGLTRQIMPEIYLPYTITGLSNRLVILTQGDPKNMTKAILNQISSIDKEQPVADVATLDQIIHEEIFAEARFNFLLLTIFACLGLILASIGLYGVMSYSIARRTQELGLRIALGAQRSDVLKLVLKQGVFLTLIGIGIGLIGSFALTHYLKTLLYNISPTDPPTFTIIACILLFVALLACLIPARWATKVDPMTALRSE